MLRSLLIALTFALCYQSAAPAQSAGKLDPEHPDFQASVEGSRDFLRKVATLNDWDFPGNMRSQILTDRYIASAVLRLDKAHNDAARSLSNRLDNLEHANVDALWNLADTEPAKYGNVAHCNCGCEQTGKCQCKNCSERTADPYWQALVKADPKPAIFEAPKTCTGPGCTCPSCPAGGRCTDAQCGVPGCMPQATFSAGPRPSAARRVAWRIFHPFAGRRGRK